MRYVESLKGVFDQAPDSISIVDLSKKLIYQNRMAVRYLGRTVDEFNAAGGFSSFYVRPELEDEVAETVISGRKWVGEVELKAGDGVVIPAMLKASGITDDAGRVIGILGVISDIREQVRAREALQRSEAYFRSLIENAHDIILVLDREGRIRYASPSFERDFDFHAGVSAFDFLHPDDLERMGEIFREGVEKPGYMIAAEYRIRTREGKWRCVEAFGKNLLDDPAVAGVVINASEITERKRAEEALRQSEERLRRITDNMMDMVSQVNAEGIFEYIGPSHHNILGYENSEMLGHSIFEFLHPDDLERITSRFVVGVAETGSLEDRLPLPACRGDITSGWNRSPTLSSTRKEVSSGPSSGRAI